MPRGKGSREAPLAGHRTGGSYLRLATDGGPFCVCWAHLPHAPAARRRAGSWGRTVALHGGCCTKGSEKLWNLTDGRETYRDSSGCATSSRDWSSAPRRRCPGQGCCREARDAGAPRACTERDALAARLRRSALGLSRATPGLAVVEGQSSCRRPRATRRPRCCWAWWRSCCACCQWVRAGVASGRGPRASWLSVMVWSKR